MYKLGMIGTFIKHEWLKFSRSPRLTTQLGQSLFSGFFAFYFVIIFLVLGYMMDRIAQSIMPDKDVLRVVTAGFFYYMIFDMMMRYFFQKFSIVQIQSYITWPIPKSHITRYLIARSWLSMFNLLPLLTVITFIWVYAQKNYSSTELSCFSIVVIGLIMSNHLWVYWLNRSIGSLQKWLLLLVAGLVGSMVLDYYQIIPLFNFFYVMAEFLLSNILLSLIPIVVGLILYGALYQSIKGLLVIEKRDAKWVGFYNPNISWFNRWGLTGHLMNLELKLMLRSKRSRTYLMMGVFFFFYPFLLNAENAENEYVILAIGLIMTGMISLNYGQMMLSWNSAHFDLLLTRSVHIKDIFRAKYYLLAIFCMISYVVTLPYYFYRPELIYASSVMLLFNMTFNLIIYMLLASINSKRIDIMAGQMMNYEGLTLTHFLIIIPMLVVPFFIYWVGERYISDEWGGYLLISTFSIVLLVMHEVLIDFCVSIFQKNRYTIAANFRIKKS
jgi:hypothetical protein